MTYKAGGSPCTVYREHVLLNSGSYSTTAGADSDDFRFNSITEGTPANGTHVHDATAYATQPTKDSWQQWIALGNTV